MEDKKIVCKECKKTFVFSVSEQQFFASKKFSDPKRCKSCIRKGNEKKQNSTDGKADDKNWEYPCDVCRAKPTVGDTGLCGPCCFGEADTADGNW